MKPKQTLALALERCPDLKTKSLEAFLGSLLDEDLEVLAQMPGTPGQVLAAQFTHYAASSVNLTEPLARRTEAFQPLLNTVLRMPVLSVKAARAAPARRTITHGAHPPHPEALSA